MQSLKTIALAQITANTLQRLGETSNTYADEILIVTQDDEFLRYTKPEEVFSPNLSEALETSKFMVKEEIYVSKFRFRGTIRKPNNGKEKKKIRITRRIPVSPGKTAKLILTIGSCYEEHLTQFGLTIRNAFPSASQIGKSFYNI